MIIGNMECIEPQVDLYNSNLIGLFIVILN